MTWRPPNELEHFLLAYTRAHWPKLIPLARVLALAPRIEPLLLRNARHRFLPGTGAEIESQLWFSPLVAARSTREIVLHLGIARVLAGQLGGAQPWPDDPSPRGDPDGIGSPDLDKVWAFTREHTRHWSPEDRLERDLRYHALRGDDDALAGGLRAILARIAAESGPEADETRRIGLSRLAKRTLPAIRPGLGTKSAETARLLARYAALALGDAGDWSAEPGSPEALPPWLSQRLPTPLGQSRLGVEIRWDKEHGQALHLVEPRQGEPAIDLPSPLPARLHVAPGGEVGKWYAVTRGTRIPIDTPSAALRLTTLDGRQWDLATDALPAGDEVATKAGPLPLQLIHIGADREQARAIADWLRGKGIPVDLVVESASRRDTATQPGPARSLRLWTRAARDLWAQAGAEPPQDPTRGLLLRIDDAVPPAGGAATGRLLDWLDWQRLGESPRSGDLLRALERWWQEGEVPSTPNPAPSQQANAPVPGDTQLPEDLAPHVTAEKKQDAETERLLAEIVEIWPLLVEIGDPETEPPRRLAIGDRLAELGDPRPGVGTVEIEVPVDEEPASAIEAAATDAAGPASRRRPSFGREIDALLAKIDDPDTEPPRRLEIGDRLAELGDPRPGVGLDARGLPDIDWVEIPGGPFIYQRGETRKLPNFWIARYPVTNAQFQAFIDDGGYDKRAGLGARIGKTLGLRAGGEPEWWTDLKRPEPEAPRWPQANRPRTNVDWYEAVAFTRWLNARLGIREGSIRLPTELEWEKAARGTEGLVYPWGNEYRSGFANVDETYGERKGPWYLTQTTAVGLYPQGRSPYEVEDLAGTVWEWCLNKYEDLSAVAPDTSGASRALRGGSWDFDPHLARAVNRYYYHSGSRYGSWGFRLLSSVHIEPVR